jgi:mannose-6-phosphate isomerase-like protein (cupin superfamily)
MFSHSAIITTDDAAEATLPVDGGHSGARVDARHDTVLSVLEGVVYVIAGDDEVALTPGDFVTIRAGVQHRYWNAGDDEARLVRRTAAVHEPQELPRAA